MAKFRPGSLVSSISGSLGGITFAAGARRPHVRPRRRPKLPTSADQLARTALLPQLQAAWLALSDSSRLAWNTAAAQLRIPDQLGRTRTPSGREIFLGLASWEWPLRRTFSDSNPNLCSGGTPSASTERVGFTASKAFDATIGYTNTWVTAVGTTTGWLKYTWPSAVNVRRIRWMDRPNDTNTGPGTWTFQRDDSGSWTTLLSKTGTTYQNGTWHQYDIPSDTPSTAWRINITANQGSASRLAISEFEMYLDPPGAPAALTQSPMPTIAAISAAAAANWTISLTLPTGYDYASLKIRYARVHRSHALAHYSNWKPLTLATYTAAPFTFMTWANRPGPLSDIDAGEVLALEVTQRLVRYPEIWLPSPKSITPVTIT